MWHRLYADRRLPGVKVISEIFIVLTVVRLGLQHVDVVADNLRGRVAEDALCSRIKRLNDAMRVDGDDSVDGAVQDGTLSFLALFERRRRLLALADFFRQFHVGI